MISPKVHWKEKLIGKDVLRLNRSPDREHRTHMAYVGKNRVGNILEYGNKRDFPAEMNLTGPLGIIARKRGESVQELKAWIESEVQKWFENLGEEK